MKITKILCASQPQLKEMLDNELYRNGYRNIVNGKGYLYAEGELPVLLVAHLDTVHKQPSPKEIMRSSDGRFVSSVFGIGGDDRCGVFMILEIIKKHKCHVLFTEDEETGAKGARAFANSNIKPDVNYIVELDRRGWNDCVFYGCDNRDFVKHIESFGFEESSGSFSDISVIAPALGIAAVNISAGYYNEHTASEYIDMNAVWYNIDRVGKLAASESGFFEYVRKEILLDKKPYKCAKWWRSA